MDRLRIACFDTGIYVAGLMRRLPPQKHLGSVVLEAARLGAFRVLMLDPVYDELLSLAQREGCRTDFEQELIEFLAECDTDWPARSKIERPRSPELILPGLRHINDLEIAYEVQHHKPDFFIHGNPEHWSSALNHLLGTNVVTPREFLLIHGIAPPPRS
jgi:hypothetical protein